MLPDDAKNLGNFIATTFMAEYGFECTEKTQWGMEQLECDVNGYLLTFKYIKNGTAIQFYLSDLKTNDNVYQEFFYITTQEQLDYFHENFIPWILTCLWEIEYEAEPL